MPPRLSAVRLLLFALLADHCTSAVAFIDHAALTTEALRQTPALRRPVTVESLPHFLLSTRTSLPAVLDAAEAWALRTQAAFGSYAARPAALAYRPATLAASALSAAFVHALRINPQMPLLALAYDPEQRLPGVALDVALLHQPDLDDGYADVLRRGRYKRLHAGQRVAALAVLAAAAEQPDLGMDVQLDHISETGVDYGFPAPPGGLASVADSDALFHMSHVAVPSWLRLLRPAFAGSYPEARFMLYARLSRFARAQQHPYWSLVFAGWALHYAQDLTQPYHADLLAGFAARDWLQLLLLGPQRLAQRQARWHATFETLAAIMLDAGDDPALQHAQQTLRQALHSRHLDAEAELSCRLGGGVLQRDIAGWSGQQADALALLMHALFPDTATPAPDASALRRQYLLQPAAARAAFMKKAGAAYAAAGSVTRNCVTRILFD